MFHIVSVWLTRLVVLGVGIALLIMYGIPKWTAEQPAAPMATAAPVTSPETPAATGMPAASALRCQPFGRTARGELVYSMDCR